ncbi:MAG: tetratricopeptide repeat protein [Legionellaceae bacterium]|nr:tetratricopeptide repeat protein [Legionellaceae bacterium]
MKSIVPCVCLVLAASSSAVHAKDVLEAYRSGHYNEAANYFLEGGKPDKVGHDYLGQMYLYGYGVLKNNQRAIQNLKAAAERGFLPAQKLMARYELIHERNPSEAIKWFKKAAESGDLKAQLYCAAAYHFGVGVKKNEDRARRYDILASKQGNSLAQASLAEHFLDSRHSSNKKLGMIWLGKALEKKEPEAEYLMAEVYVEGKLAPKDLDEAKRLYDSALAAGYLPAMQGLSELAKLNGDETLAKTWSDKFEAATSKIPDTPEVLASRWLSRDKFSDFKSCGYGLSGILTEWTDGTARHQNRYNQPPQMTGISRKTLYKPRFVMMEPNTIPLTAYYDVLVKALPQSSDGRAFEFPKYGLDIKKYSVLLEEKAALGDPTAQFALGQLYHRGVSVKQDNEKAVEYYMQAIAQQDLKAEYTLGIFYLTGEGGEPDYKQAMGWLSDAAFKGNPEAQYVLGHLYEVGQKDAEGAWAIEPNPERAMSMYALSAFNQNPLGEYHLAEMMVRDKTGSLSVQEQQKRHALMKRLYQDAAAKGIKSAVLPLAFFDAMDTSKEKQAHALEVAKEEAKNGDSKAALLYGMLLDRGIGTAPDPSEAVYWYKKADKNPVSAFILGTYYATGHEVGEDQEKSAELLQQASSAGFSFADFNLAILSHDRNMPFLPLLEKAHEAGNSRASLLLADNALTSAEDDASMKAARAIYQALAERGDKDAQLKLAYLFEQGLGGNVQYDAAENWYTLSAKQGQPVAQYLLGRLNQMGKTGQFPDYKAAKYWYQKAMNQYNPAAIALGFVYETVDNDYPKALKAYDIAAQKENATGQFDVALMYEYGKGRPVDTDKAEEIYLKAAERGHVRAMVQLAGIYLHDTGKFRNEKIALEWYEKAAARGNRDALYYLGQMAEKGQGMSKDTQKALQHYQASADKGNAKAMLALASLYARGDGVEKDPAKAAALYQKLSERGNGYAQYQLAMLYYQGALGDVNEDKAKRWLKQAGQNGCIRAQQTLQWINAKGSETTSFIEPLSLGVATSAWFKWK